ncbi:MAG: type II toxin-antitoxin system RelE/ParE family toxin [Aeromicrobium sp.]|nr:MAG: type II toxin-antitoxin system RelE/ParE family toxin [Aeromicrobium sp.]
MTGRILRVHPDVINSDVPAALAYYDQIDRALGDRFGQLISDVLDGITKHPLFGREYLPGFRRVVTVPFPYMLVYVVEGSSIYVLALLHTKRNPDANRAIVQERGGE